LKEEKDDGRFEELASILYDQAVLSEGKNLPNSAEYVKRVNSFLVDLIN
jgi:molecular chaperone HtpG